MRFPRTFAVRLAAAWLGLGAAALAETPPAAEPPTGKPDRPNQDDDKNEKTPAPAPDLPPGTILAADELPIDLGTALRLAEVENPDLMLARERVTEAAALRQLAAQLLPNLNAGTNYDLHRRPVQRSSGTIINVNREALYYGLGANAVGSGTVSSRG